MKTEIESPNNQKIKNIKPYIIALLVFVLFALIWNSVLKNIKNDNPIVTKQDSLSLQPKKSKTKVETFSKELEESYLIGKLTKEMKLTVGEAQKFWPIYNEHKHKKDSLNSNLKSIERRIKESVRKDSLSILLDIYNKTTFQKAKLKNDYHELYKNTITAEKLAKFYFITK